ncbi:bublin coiled-coil protein [Festucalex cinctus]
MSGPNGDPVVSIDDGIIEDDDEVNDEEFAAINSMLDQINSYLDGLEEKNDALNNKMHELLESHRQARLEFRAQLEDRRPGDSLQGTEKNHNEDASN